MRKDKKTYEEYIPLDPLAVLKGYEPEECFKEVLYTFGEQEIVKENGKFYLVNTFYPSYSKEITREMANEIWQSYNMKERSDTSLSFK